MNIHAFDLGYCGYCGAPMEDWEPKHIEKHKRAQEQRRKDNDPAYQLKRIADKLATQGQ